MLTHRLILNALPPVFAVLVLVVPVLLVREAVGQVSPVPPVAFNEVLADAPGPEGSGGGEWVELRNGSDAPVDLSGWAIGDEKDPIDRLMPWEPGGTLLLQPKTMALVLDPDGDPSELALPAGVLLLRPEDASIGNGLKGDGESLWLLDPSRTVVDSVRWPFGAGDGISWEHVGGGAAAGDWRPCRAPGGSTPGRVNSWTPVPGDRSIRWRGLPGQVLSAGRQICLIAVLMDEGGDGLQETLLEAAAISPWGGVEQLPSKVVSGVAPWDSTEVGWMWRPAGGGGWKLLVEVVEPPATRGWDDSDTLHVPVRYALLSRVLSEAQPRPVKGCGEWLELWAPDHGAGNGSGQTVSWDGWSVRVRSKASPLSAGRLFLIGNGSGQVLLVSAGDSVRTAGADGIPSGSGEWIIWPGLRLTDTGSIVTIADPYGAVVDSSVLRPVPGLPRGHSWQRWNPSIPGWSPRAWGVSRSPGDVSPGWVVGPVSTEPDIEEKSEAGQEWFRLELEHLSDGSVLLVWESSAARVWLEARLYDMSGRLAATLIPQALVPGSSSHQWHPAPGGRSVRPGIYILVVEAGDADAGARWTVRRPLGVRP